MYTSCIVSNINGENMKIYNYHSNTKEFIGESYAQLDPLETELQNKNIYLTPKYATTENPPIVKVEEVAVFENGWVIKEDHRGKTVFDTATAEPMVIDQIGPMPVGFTLEIPMSGFVLWNGTKWVIDTDKKNKALNDEKVNKEIRKIAIDSLISKGELPVDYK